MNAVNAVGGLLFALGGIILAWLGIRRGIALHVSPELTVLVFAASLILGVIFVLVGSFYIYRGWVTSRFETKRSAILARNEPVIERFANRRASQPEARLQRQIVIEHRASTLQLAVQTLIILVCIESLFVLILFINQGSLRDALNTVKYTALGVLFILLPAISRTLYVTARQRITIDADGMTVEHGDYRSQNKQSLSWDDARIFALVPPGRAGTFPECYEVGSENMRVRWTRLGHPMIFRPWWVATISRPTVPFEQYEPLMEETLTVIHEQTGLTLLDLRDSWVMSGAVL